MEYRLEPTESFSILDIIQKQSRHNNYCKECAEKGKFEMQRGTGHGKLAFRRPCILNTIILEIQYDVAEEPFLHDANRRKHSLCKCLV